LKFEHKFTSKNVGPETVTGASHDEQLIAIKNLVGYLCYWTIYLR
jgi:hypothetical protein